MQEFHTGHPTDLELPNQTEDLVVEDESQENWSEAKFIKEMDELAATINTGTPAKAPKTLGMFSLKRYMVKKAQTRLTKATFRQAKREAKAAKK